AVFFALLYLLTLEEALCTDRSLRFRTWMLLLAIAAGSLAFMVKVTTLPIVLIPLIWCAAKAAIVPDPLARYRIRLNAGALAITGASCVLPFLAGYVWTADA